MTSNQTAKSSIVNSVATVICPGKLQIQALQRARSTLYPLQAALASDGSPLKKPSSCHPGSQTWLHSALGPGLQETP